MLSRKDRLKLDEEAMALELALKRTEVRRAEIDEELERLAVNEEATKVALETVRKRIADVE